MLDGDRASVQEDQDDDEPDKNKNEEILEDPESKGRIFTDICGSNHDDDVS